MVGIGNLTSGILFGAGCLFAEYIDSNWVQSDRRGGREASSTESAQTSMQKRSFKTPFEK
jgi:hypothetical protein